METPQKIIDRKTQQKTDFIERFKKTPIIQVVCGQVGIARSTFYRWIKEDAVFHQQHLEADKEGREYVNDFMESVLIQQAKSGNNTAALIFYLKKNHPRYADSVSGLTPDDIREIAEYIENPRGEQNDFQFLARLFKRRIPINVGRYILQVMRNLTNIRKIKNDQKKISFLSKLMGNS